MHPFGYLTVASALHDSATVDRVSASVRAAVVDIGGTLVDAPEESPGSPLAIVEPGRTVGTGAQVLSTQVELFELGGAHLASGCLATSAGGPTARITRRRRPLSPGHRRYGPFRPVGRDFGPTDDGFCVVVARIGGSNRTSMASSRAGCPDA